MELKDGSKKVVNCKTLNYFRYLPKTNNFFEEKKITIISARSMCS